MEDKWLGKNVDYPLQYAPETLVGIPRALNRQLIGLNDSSMPFTGFDVWHAYEFSCLTNQGLPVVALLKIIYPANSPNLIESKSLKLYLNSFNMSRLGKDKSDAIREAKIRIQSDLSKTVGTEVNIHFHEDPDQNPHFPFDFKNYSLLERNVDMEGIQFTEFAENPSLLSKSEGGNMRIYSQLLRSNCKITYQPDWGNVYISMEGEDLPQQESLLKYLVSFRDERHFHEEICESIFYHLNRIFKPNRLMVSCLYTRRGGIDICPIRTNDPILLPHYLIQADILTQKHLRQ
jgi:7-cyano-7-deazaguanine reductase